MANTQRRIERLARALLHVCAGSCLLMASVVQQSVAQISSMSAATQLTGQTEGGKTDGASRPGQQAGGGPTIAPEDLARMKLSPGSLIDVHVYEESDLDGSYRLDDEGEINMPVVGRIKLLSLNLPQAETAISAKLASSEVLHDPHVMVNINQYSPLYVLVEGEVVYPGRLPVLGSQRLPDILATAGGETHLAGDEVVIHRANQPAGSGDSYHYSRNATDPKALEIEVNPGDTVQVKRAGVVYVLGAVARPGGYLMQEDGKLDVAQALALAGGANMNSKVSSMRIIHKLPDGTLQEIPVQYKKISKGEVAPVELAAQDIVYVPVSSMKTGLMQGTQIMATATGAAIYTIF